MVIGSWAFLSEGSGADWSKGCGSCALLLVLFHNDPPDTYNYHDDKQSYYYGYYQLGPFWKQVFKPISNFIVLLIDVNREFMGTFAISAKWFGKSTSII